MPDTANQSSPNWFKPLLQAWPAIVVLALLALVPTISSMLDNPFIIRLFTRVVIFAIVAVALNFVLVYGALVSMVHAVFFGIGAYFCQHSLSVPLALL